MLFELWYRRRLLRALGCKESKPVNPKGNQPWIFTGRTDAKAEAPPMLWPPDAKSWLIRKNPDAGEDWRQEKKGMTKDEMVGWMASPTQWTWVWASSKRWWRTGKSGCATVHGVTKVGHDLATEQQPWLKDSLLFAMPSYGRRNRGIF